jgi:hypothetical protein
MAITHTFFIDKVYAIPQVDGKTDVISVVQWHFVFDINGTPSTAAGVSVLDTTNIADFTSITDVNKDMVEQWVIAAEGGQGWFDQLVRSHTTIVKMQEALSKSVPITVPALQQ